jgi:agmatinase
MALYYSTPDSASAAIIFVGMPLDRTSSFTSGSRFGPALVRVGADNVESWSPYQRRDVSAARLHDAGDVEFSYATPSAPFELIGARARSVSAAGRKLLAFGGEHSITGPIVGTLVALHPDLCVIHFDAHSDLRDEFLGERVCHATAMRRVLDHVPADRLFQLGIRSFADPAEMDRPNVFPFEVEKPVPEVRRRIGTRPVYVTLDVDVLDPGAMPEVQTPEPGGCTYRELARGLAALAGLNVVGADIVEFAPRNSQPSVGAATAAGLVREIALLLS